MDHAFWGSKYTNAQVADAIRNAGVQGRLIEDERSLLDAAAERVAAGQVIGWFQDRFEWGPRALGNRSIVADPRRADMKDIVNTKIKFREPFRPFAPSVLAGSAERYFELPNANNSLPARFMLLVVPVRDEMQEVIPAVNHLGTARLQTVHEDVNGRYHGLIKRVGEATGHPLVLNTSFNVRGEPIVESPADALRTFANSGLDALVMENYLVEKKAGAAV
jgi:carbamoyltransferase